MVKAVRNDSMTPLRSAGPAEFFLPGMLAPMPLVRPQPAKHWDPLVTWFGPIMRGTRRWRALALIEAARRAQCSDDTLRRLEEVRCAPPLDLAQRLCRVYGVPLGAIIAEAERLAAAAGGGAG